MRLHIRTELLFGYTVT